MAWGSSSRGRKGMNPTVRLGFRAEVTTAPQPCTNRNVFALSHVLNKPAADDHADGHAPTRLQDYSSKGGFGRTNTV